MESRNPARSVGLFVTIALGVIAVLILQFSKGSSLFRRGYSVIVKSSNVGGLQVGASVMISGVPCGKVVGLELAQDGRSVLIECWLERRFLVYDDARFTLEQSGFLGDQYVSIVPTQNKGNPLKDGALALAEQPFNLQEAARKAMGLMEKLDSAAVKLDGAVARVDATILSTNTLEELQSTVTHVKNVSARADQTLLEAQSLIRDNRGQVANSISNIHHFSTVLAGAAQRIDHLMETNEPRWHNTFQDLEITASEFRQVALDVRRITSDLQEGRGVVGSLLKDPELQGQLGHVVENFSVLSSNLTQQGLFWKPPRTNGWFRMGNPFR